MLNIVLAHGILGFGGIAESPINYFNGVADHLRRQGHTVITPQVNPIGRVIQRSEQLVEAINQQLPTAEQIHIIAHSMGGLDARYALAHNPGLAGRVKTLVTIGAPHRGSPVADAIRNPADPLFEAIPPILRQWLEENMDGLLDLTTQAGANFDQVAPDVEGVRYIEVAGDASKGGHELFLFQIAATLGGITGEVNDGVVTKSSALRDGHEHLEDWPVDHAGEIGWSFETIIPIVPPRQHLARYSAIIETINNG